MSLSINSSNYSSIDTNSARYKAAKKMVEAGEVLDGGFKTKEQQLIDEIFGGKEARIRNWMRYFDEDGDYINPVNGLAGLDATGKNPSEYQQIISISDEGKQSMWNMVKSEFIENYGVHNGDTTKRSEVYTNYYKSIAKDDRLSAGWTMEQYEHQYRQAFAAAAKAADPSWKAGNPIPSGALDSITRESVESTLSESGSSFVKKSIDVSI